MAMADWSNFPDELLVEILNRLTINADYIRFHAVCHHWRSAALLPKIKRFPHHQLPCQLPWLMLPYKDENSTLRGFFILSNNKVHWLELPEARDKRCCGSSQGWLVFVEESPVISLLNPLTRAEIQLPPVTAIPNILDFRVMELGKEYVNLACHGGISVLSLKDVKSFYMRKVILSKNPTLDDYLAMSIFGDQERLAFCRAGDKKWTVIKEDHRSYEDMIYYNGQFYAVDCHGEVVVCDITGPSPKVITITPRENNLCCKLDKKYLVELSGELLLIYRHIAWHKVYPNVKYEDCEEVEIYETLFFKVFKLNQNQKWVNMKSLGDYMLFLGDNCSLSLCAKDFPGAKANCIYFTDDYLEAYLYTAEGRDLGIFNLEDESGRRFPSPGHDLGMFNLEDESVQRFPCPMDKSRLIVEPPMWVTPSLY